MGLGARAALISNHKWRGVFRVGYREGLHRGHSTQPLIGCDKHGSRTSISKGDGNREL